jgi:hypothetical protein
VNATTPDNPQLPTVFISSTKMAQLCGANFCTFATAVSKAGLEVDAVHRFDNGGYLPLWREDRVEELRAVVREHLRKSL